MITVVIIAAFSVSLAAWIIGLSWSPSIWLVIMAVSALATIQLWRLAGRPIPPVDDGHEPGPSDDEVSGPTSDARLGSARWKRKKT